MSLRCTAAAATSKIPIERSVPFTTKRPPVNSRSAAATSSTWLAMRSPLAMISFDAPSITMLPSRSARPECEPPPTETRAVSPCTSATLSSGTPSHSLTSWAKLVSCPWPLETVPMTTSTTPSGCTVISARSRGTPVAVST